jgi:hypothetical protein
MWRENPNKNGATMRTTSDAIYAVMRGDGFDGRFEIWMLVLNVGVRNAHPNLHDEV